MSATQLLRTAADQERALVFIEHIRLRCDVCGVTVQPSDLERTLWVSIHDLPQDRHICPSCIKPSNHFRKPFLTGGYRVDSFDDAITDKAAGLRDAVKAAEDTLKKARAEWFAFVDEATAIVEQYKWIDKAVFLNQTINLGFDF